MKDMPDLLSRRDLTLRMSFSFAEAETRDRRAPFP